MYLMVLLFAIAAILAAVWLPSFRRVLLGIVSYVVAIVLHDVSADHQTLVYLIAGGVVLVLLVVDEWFTQIKPAKRIEELAPIALDGLAEPLLSQLKNVNVAARINLMVPCRPLRGFGLFRYFKMKWSKEMKNQPDVNIRFRITQGITGECFRSKKPVYANSDQIRSKPFALPKNLQSKVPALQAIFAYPVYKPAKRGQLQSGKLIGVLNLDSITNNAYNIVTDQQVFDGVDESMQNIATIAAHFYE
jgi:hypothetical protein